MGDLVTKPIEISYPELYASGKSDGIAKIKACGNYTAVRSKSKKILVSDKKSKGLVQILTRESKIFEELYLSMTYVIFVDNEGSLFQYVLDWTPVNDKKVGIEILHKSELIDVYPGEKEIWGINLHRQAFHLPLDLSQKTRSGSTLNYYRPIANVQKLLIGEKHKVCVKAVKRPAIYSEGKEGEILSLTELCTDHLLSSLVILPLCERIKLVDFAKCRVLLASCGQLLSS